MSRLISFIASASFATLAVAGGIEFTIAPLTIQVPEGFKGPIQQEHQGATVVGFGKPHPNSQTNTLFQVSLYDFGSKLGALSEAKQAEAAKKYLLEFVAGIERRRTNFKRTDPHPMKLAGIPAAKLQWTGEFQSKATVGVMYCFVVGTKVISFHTQDFGTEPTDAMKEAMKSIEGVRLSVAG